MTLIIHCISTLGSSPRVRSGRAGDESRPQVSGIISACAERSSKACTKTRKARDHLRVCGAVDGTSLGMLPRPGSSPRVRSGQLYFIGIWSGWMVRNV